MGKWYQVRDKDLIDYQLYEFNNLTLRGPKTNDQKYIAYLGAAQTFGAYCPNPFPTILGNELKIGTLNLGYGGAGPMYFLNSPDSSTILEAVNHASLAVVQVMSGRSVSNSVFKSLNGTNTGLRLPDRQQMHSDIIWKDLVWARDKRGLDIQFMKDLIEETQKNYVSAMIDLLKTISCPKILLWFSVRSPQELTPHSQFQGNSIMKKVFRKLGLANDPIQYFGQFPQLVNQTMVDQIKNYSDYYVECISNKGMPQKLVNFQGKVVGQNSYYPSPEMHQQAAEQLLPVCQQILNS